MIKNVIMKYRQEGILSVILAVYRRLFPIKAKAFHLIKKIVSSGEGLEVGGLSSIFQQKNIIPVYAYIKSLDNCNFSRNTIWEGQINESLPYIYSKDGTPGKQYVMEATDLHEIQDDRYDFLLSSHMLEHTANPIKALKEWQRVIKANGHLILVIPHKDGTFDHRRPVTKLEHVIQDYENNITEKDLTHIDEILELHDLSMDLEAGGKQHFIERSKKNDENRCLHHHVFNSLFVIELINYLNLEIKVVEAIEPMHILVVAQKLSENKVSNNEDFMKYVRLNEFKSPFPSDKI